VQLTTEQFQCLFPRTPEPEAWTGAINAVCPKYGIDTYLRLAAFLSQCGHESSDFTRLVEGLNYSASALTRTWPKRFPAAVAGKYARQPERIANRAYADRMGNGPEESGDGWKHRGRGAIQVTGKENYLAFAEAAGKSYEEVFDYLETREGAIESACWFWSTNVLNIFADRKWTETITRRINGGTNGLEDRKARYAAALKVLA